MPNTGLDRLKNQLLTSGLQQKNQPLFQVINELIGQMQTLSKVVGGSASSSSGSVSDATFLTSINESILFPNSRELLAGTGISFDDSVANRRTISTINSGNNVDILTDGNIDETELIYANGEVILTIIHG